ncbi:protein crooked neck [Apis mellifera caucasica]|uniref:Protein crooked neck n=1 Tax=Apis mellifera TaxID=7460 RepID=A0A7M7TFR7_APIME|nr:protein crooked neck [Apis mellifera]KAG6803599.1 protein crooked neck [Apis mellifera caucasica]KAG9430620.1 protein crooked neck [Apis mellifera carnica]|eukprot:XP_624146.2 protein crooked neck [Apis mellifera]
MEKSQKMPKVAKVKNKAPAEIQITAEQLLREAKERDLEILPPPPKQKISDPHELADYQHRKRKAFEDNIRKNRMVISNWIKYAQWEESQKQIQRARSIYERALDVDHRNITLWLKYTEMEMRNRQVNHARNLWDRAVTILPRANQFWYKYTYMEEMLENIAGARQVFERWMEWEPDEQAWQTYIKFELRYKEIQRARQIYERFVMVHPEVKHWIKYARFEESHGFINGARNVYERAIDFYGDENLDERLFIAFAKFEEGQREHDRARVIYKYALDHIPKEKTQEIYKAYTIHEKKYGDRSGIEDVIVSKRKYQYEQEVKENPSNYDAWFDYLRLVESEGNVDIIRETYERAVANVPPTKEKQFWRRYIYLWINYALFEELDTEDIERCRQVYRACLELIPHKHFTFSKIWLYYANFEIRQKNLTAARKTLGMALGICPRDKLYRGYIDLEIQLREFDRCRILYEKFLEFGPENCTTWMKFAELETLLGDVERARAIYELAISQSRLDMPELLWKSYIDFEISQDETENARQLFERLLERTLHVKVWIAYAKFELANSTSEDDFDNVVLARRIFERGNDALRQNGDKESRALLLEAWRDFENEKGDDETRAKIMEKMPRRIKRRRRIVGEDGSDDGWEEIFDFVFPEDESQRPNLKFLASAKAWIKNKEISEKNENNQSDSNS